MRIQCLGGLGGGGATVLKFIPVKLPKYTYTLIQLLEIPYILVYSCPLVPPLEELKTNIRDAKNYKKQCML